MWKLLNWRNLKQLLWKRTVNSSLPLRVFITRKANNMEFTAFQEFPVNFKAHWKCDLVYCVIVKTLLETNFLFILKELIILSFFKLIETNNYWSLMAQSSHPLNWAYLKRQILTVHCSLSVHILIDYIPELISFQASEGEPLCTYGSLSFCGKARNTLFTKWGYACRKTQKWHYKLQTLTLNITHWLKLTLLARYLI